MKVEPELPTIPKFRRLKKRVGAGAMEYLIRIWAHCQQNHRGELWRKADAMYLEEVCEWDGNPGELYKAMTEMINGRPGWIVAEDNGLRIHDWNKENRGLLSARANGSNGGRKRRPTPLSTGNLPVIGGLPPGTPPPTVGPSIDRLDRVDGGDEKDDACSPTFEEWTSACEMRGLPAWLIQDAWAKLGEKNFQISPGIRLTRSGLAHRVSRVFAQWEADGRPAEMRGFGDLKQTVPDKTPSRSIIPAIEPQC